MAIEASQTYTMSAGSTEILVFDFSTRLAVVFDGGLDSADATTAVLAPGASSSDDTYNNYRIVLTSGTGSGAGQSATITDYTGSSRTATVAGWQETPSADTMVKIVDVFSSLTGITEVDTSDLTLADAAITTEITHDVEDIPVGQALTVKVTAPSAAGDYKLSFNATSVRGEKGPFVGRIEVV